MIDKIRNLLKQESVIQFIKFGCVGALNTFLNLGIFNSLYYLLNVNYVAANAVAWFITVGISYVLNNILTFKDNGKIVWSFKALVKVYVSYSITGLFLVTILLKLWVDILGIPAIIASVIDLFFTVPINFLLNKYWAYGKK